jgi:hypothetical protein
MRLLDGLRSIFGGRRRPRAVTDRVVEPLLEVLDALEAVAGAPRWTRVDHTAIAAYTGPMLTRSLPDLIDAHVAPEAIAALDPRELQRIAMILVADFVRRRRASLAPELLGLRWVDALLKALEDEYLHWRLDHQPLFDLDKTAWAIDLARRLGARDPDACSAALASAHGALSRAKRATA